MQVAKGYVQKRDDVWYVVGSGVQVLGVIAMGKQGFSPEEIQAGFPALSLKEVYGTILFYLERVRDLRLKDGRMCVCQAHARPTHPM